MNLIQDEHFQVEIVLKPDVKWCNLMPSHSFNDYNFKIQDTSVRVIPQLLFYVKSF